MFASFFSSFNQVAVLRLAWSVLPGIDTHTVCEEPRHWVGFLIPAERLQHIEYICQNQSVILKGLQAEEGSE